MQNPEQLKSSDPLHSVWVSASAGTGKTKVLTDRVLRLLLSGTIPAKILCLTFTNAAASEMMSRINYELKMFAQSNNEELNTKLIALLGRNPLDSEISLARRLFLIMLNSLEKVQVQTIHAFCQSLLRKFPFEAGVTPGFEVIDDIASGEILRKVSNVVFAHHEEGEMGEALGFIAANIHDSTMTDLVQEIVDAKIKFKTLTEHFSNKANYKELLRALMQCENKTEDEIINEITSLTKLLHKEHNIFSDILEKNQLSPQNTEAIDFDLLKKSFLTQKGEPVKRLMNKADIERNPIKFEYLTILQDKFTEASNAVKTLRLIDASGHLFVIASNIINAYEDHKRERGFLDYDDLIYLTQKLLTSGEFKQWILYKLDGGLDAILVDEAQDTSESQWKIIEALMQEFYAGMDEKLRSMFVVGDEKQSIYSFQGASLGAYTGMNKYLKDQMLAAKKPYSVIDLAWSYRSTNAVVDVVNSTFNNIEESLFPSIQPLKVFRHAHPGRVELWPLIKQEAKPDIFWPIFKEDTEDQTSSEKLAKTIAQFIKKELEEGKILPSTGRPVAPQDFMILLRRRGTFASRLIKALQNEKVECGGIDRLELSESLSVLDLISLSKFVLQPLDDLNLACLLKSPIIGVSEEGLQEIIIGTKIKEESDNFANLTAVTEKLKLYHKLQEPKYIDISQKLEQFRSLYETKSMSEFLHIVVDGLGYREELLKHDGAEASDTINEFLYRADNFAKNISSSLQEFVIWFSKNDQEIKRDVQNNDKVRIMTVHGSKGLQSGIVILADTTNLPKSSNKILWIDDEMPLWKGIGDNKNNYFDQHKKERGEREYKEYLRLLYVAMTRAEDRLIITGETKNQDAQEKSWYNVIQKGMESLGAEKESYDFLEEPLSVYETLGISLEVRNNLRKKVELPLPSLPPVSYQFSNFAVSNISQDLSGSPPSPLDNLRGITYGQIFHKIMEDVIKTRAPFLEQSHPMLELLPMHQRNFISSKIKQLLLMPEFQEILRLDAKTEVSIGLQKNEISIGRIDLMAIGTDEVIILDYKTDKHPALTKTDIPIKYIKQLEFYRETVQKIYPDHAVKTKILWLENLTLTDI